MKCVNGAIVNNLLVLTKRNVIGIIFYYNYITYNKLQMNASDRPNREGDKRMREGALEVKRWLVSS